MAKVSFSKLGLKVNTDIKHIAWNDQEIEVKQYLPHNDKLKLISDVMNKSADDNLFMNSAKVDLFFSLGVLDYYTNISFTEKQKEDFLKTYDSVVSSGFLDAVLGAIPAEEFNALKNYCIDIIKEDYHQKNSALGIMDTIGKNYKNAEFDAEKIRQTLADGEGMEFLKEVLDKMG